MSYFRRNVTRMQPEALLPSAAIAEMVRKEGPYLQRVLLKCGVHERDVEDELQEIWEKTATRPVPGSIHGWLVRAAVGRAANYRQKLKRRLALRTGSDQNRDPEAQSIEDQLCDRGPNPEQIATAAELARLVEQLDPKLRAVTVACIAGESTKEVSERLQIPEGTVSTRLRLARTRIKRALVRSNRKYPCR